MFRLPFYIDWEQAFNFWIMLFAPVMGLGWYVGCCCDSSEEPCTNCEPGTTPEDIQVDIASVADNANCDDCGSLNATYITTHISPPTDLPCLTQATTNVGAPGFTNCSGTGNLQFRCVQCDMNGGVDGFKVSLRTGLITTGAACGTVEANGTVGGGIAGGQMDCSRSHTGASLTGVATLCDWTSATFDITPVAAD